MPKLNFLYAAKSGRVWALNPITALKSLAVAYGFTLAVFAVFAVLITYTSVPDAVIGTVVLVTMVFAVMLAGFSSSKGASSRGWLNGALGGLLYVFILYILGAVFVTGLVFGKNVIRLSAIGFFAGAFGGIVGINVGKK